MSELIRQEAIGTVPPVVLVVDDEPNVVRALTRVLRHEEYRVLTASSGEDAVVVLERLLTEGQAVAAVVSDYWMPGMHGLALLCHVRERSPQTARIVLSGHADSACIQAALNQGQVFRFLAKPWDSAELRTTLRGAVARFSNRVYVRSAFANHSLVLESAPRLADQV